MRFDLTSDGELDLDDLARLIQDVLGTNYGDANLDGIFDSKDLLQITETGHYEDDVVGNSTWADGDWNCDAEFTTDDIVLALSTATFTTGTLASVRALRETDRSAVASALSAELVRTSTVSETDAISKKKHDPSVTSEARGTVAHAPDDVFASETQSWTEFDTEAMDQIAVDQLAADVANSNAIESESSEIDASLD